VLQGLIHKEAYEEENRRYLEAEEEENIRRLEAKEEA